MSKEELEKLEREKYVVERKLTAAMHKEKRLQSELKRLTRSERTHRLCTRAGIGLIHGSRVTRIISLPRHRKATNTA